MAECAIYARVSTKEQQAEGYSIPAQLKAIRVFCAELGLEIAAEFVEAESAGKAGRSQFGKMLRFFEDHPGVRVVVAHKLDRLYRNMKDPTLLEDELGVRARYVIGDVPDTPQGELVRDVNLSVAKFYLSNLREEVRKGMDEKVAQGGWPHWAPVGYRNNKETRSLVVDQDSAELIRHAFRRYATGSVSLNDLASELFGLGFRSRSGARVYASSLQVILRNPIYAGLLRYKGQMFQGTHEPLISPELFQVVQDAFEPNRNGNKAKKHVFALRDWLVCGECGCKITAEHQRGHVYYRCTHGKGRDACSQRSYTREESLAEQIDTILGTIEIDQEIIDALVRDSKALDAEQGSSQGEERARLLRAIEQLDSRVGKLLDGYLEGIVSAESYRAKDNEIACERRAFERRVKALDAGSSNRTAQVEALARTAASARLAFAGASVDGKRRVLAGVLLNASVAGGEITSYQFKSPFEVLVKDPSGALIHPWWAM